MSPFGTKEDEIETDSTFETFTPCSDTPGINSLDFGHEGRVGFGDQLFTLLKCQLRYL